MQSCLPLSLLSCTALKCNTFYFYFLQSEKIFQHYLQSSLLSYSRGLIALFFVWKLSSHRLLLWLQCHYSYNDCGLGSDGTDRLVKLVQEMQHSRSSHSDNSSLFGAKITGGGSGGSVCVIGRNCVRSCEEILEVMFNIHA